MRAMVTGGAGFIGSHIVTALVDDGWAVVSIDDYSAGKHENLAHLKGRILEVECSVCSNRIRNYLNGVDVVFHNAASKKNVCLNNPIKDLGVNAGGTLNLLRHCRDAGVKRFIHASTGSVYGEVEGKIDENTLTRPVSYYGVSKLAGERYVSMFQDLDPVILRYFHVYGDRQEDRDDTGGVVAIFRRRAREGLPLVIHGDGSQVRSFTHVDDIVRINKYAAKNGMSGVYNCASGIKVTVKELAEKISDNIVYADSLEGDIHNFDIDNTKIRNYGIEFMGIDEGLNGSPFHVKQYKDYDNYLEHQRSKYENDIPWLKNYEKNYRMLLDAFLPRCRVSMQGKSCLCIGARQGTEVEAFIGQGAFAVGIDVNPGKVNNYVVTGDGSDIKYPDKSIDIVYTNAMDHFLKIEQTLDEIKRVLKPNGCFILIIGTPEDARKDKHGSTWWDSEQAVYEYLEKKYGYKLIVKFDLKKTKWFSEMAVFSCA